VTYQFRAERFGHYLWVGPRTAENRIAPASRANRLGYPHSPSYRGRSRARAHVQQRRCKSESQTERDSYAVRHDGRFTSAPRPKCAAVASEVGGGAAMPDRGGGSVCGARCEPVEVAAMARVERAGPTAALGGALGPRARPRAAQSYGASTPVVLLKTWTRRKQSILSGRGCRLARERLVMQIRE